MTPRVFVASVSFFVAIGAIRLPRLPTSDTDSFTAIRSVSSFEPYDASFFTAAFKLD